MPSRAEAQGHRGPLTSWQVPLPPQPVLQGRAEASADAGRRVPQPCRPAFLAGVAQEAFHLSPSLIPLPGWASLMFCKPGKGFPPCLGSSGGEGTVSLTAKPISSMSELLTSQDSRAPGRARNGVWASPLVARGAGGCAVNPSGAAEQDRPIAVPAAGDVELDLISVTLAVIMQRRGKGWANRPGGSKAMGRCRWGQGCASGQRGRQVVGCGSVG